MGVKGQTQIARAGAQVSGSGLDAEVCALYLSGAGVARLCVHASLVARVRAQNALVQVSSHDFDGPFGVRLIDPPELVEEAPSFADVEDPVGAGARAARWVLARALSGRGEEASS